MPWKRFILMVLLGYFAANIFFASLYYLAGPQHFGNLTHTDRFHEFLELFFFSAQTLTTVGYGFIYPSGTLVSSIAAVESMMGLMLFALATGGVFLAKEALAALRLGADAAPRVAATRFFAENFAVHAGAIERTVVECAEGVMGADAALSS